MVNIWTTPAIGDNGTFEISEINGEILKIVVFVKTVLSTVKIKMMTLDGETLCDDYLKETPTRFYPKNVTHISQEQTHIDNYFVYGPLTFTVSGLGDGEQIESIAIYYK